MLWTSCALFCHEYSHAPESEAGEGTGRTRNGEQDNAQTKCVSGMCYFSDRESDALEDEDALPMKSRARFVSTVRLTSFEEVTHTLALVLTFTRRQRSSVEGDERASN